MESGPRTRLCSQTCSQTVLGAEGETCWAEAGSAGARPAGVNAELPLPPGGALIPGRRVIGSQGASAGEATLLAMERECHALITRAPRKLLFT